MYIYNVSKKERDTRLERIGWQIFELILKENINYFYVNEIFEQVKKELKDAITKSNAESEPIIESIIKARIKSEHGND